MITNSLFAQNHNCANQAPIEIFNADSIIIANNSIVDNWGNQGGGIFMAECANIFLRNNIIWGNSNFQVAVLGNNDNYISEYNNIQNWTENSKNKSTDPKFENKINYFLSASSPCINSGIPYTLFSDNDDSRNDIGYTGGNGLSIDFLQIDFKENTILSKPVIKQFRIFNNSQRNFQSKQKTFTKNFSVIDTSSIFSFSKNIFNVNFSPNSIGFFKDSIQLSTNNGKSIYVNVTGIGIEGKSLNGKLAGRLACNGSPYLVVGNIIVEQNDTLVIESCVDMYFLKGTSFTIKGTLIAKGDNTHQISFKSNKPDGIWNGVYIEGNANLYNCRFEQLSEFIVSSQTLIPNYPKSVYFVNCDFTNIKTSKSLLYFTNTFDSELNIVACKFTNNEASSIISAEVAKNLRVINTLITSNSGKVLCLEALSNVKIYNSTIYNNKVIFGKRNPCITLWYASKLEINNSICWNPDSPYLYNENPYWSEVGKNLLTVNNCIMNFPKDSVVHDAGGETKWENNIYKDPQVVSQKDKNYRLRIDSPGIDKGNNSFVSFSKDLDNHTRIWDGDGDHISIVDIGCYEFGAPSNITPLANAGSDQSVNENTIVLLDGSQSSDPDGNPLTYKWTAPAGITLSSTTAQKPTFTAPEVSTNTNYTFSLVVNDGTVDSPADQVVITVKNVNKAPVANAGSDQTVNEGATATLDGSQSSDLDGDTLTLKWTAPTGITLSSNTAPKPAFTAPEVSANTNYTFSLVVNDGTVDSPIDQVVITVKNVNKAPIANAGSDQSVNEGATTTIDGSQSSDPDGNPLSYKWTVPAGITLSSTTAQKPTFTAPEVSTNTNYTFTLVVNDGTNDSPADQVVITVKNVNKAPIANAGSDQTVNEGATVTLDGSTSSDPDGNSFTYKWTAPAGITLSSTTVQKPTFTAPEVSANTNYTFSLVVNDGTVDSPVDQVVVTVKNVNKAPVANAGSDQTINEGITVTLDGSQSSDPDGSPLTFKWTAPAGIKLSSTTAQKPTFTAPEVKKDSTISFSLIVNDGFVNSAPAAVNINVLNVIKVGNSEIESVVFKIYPNPTTGIITLELSQNSGKKTEVSVSNMIGAQVFSKDVSSFNKIQIDLSNQVSGIYLLKVTDENRHYFSKIVVKKE